MVKDPSDFRTERNKMLIALDRAETELKRHEECADNYIDGVYDMHDAAYEIIKGQDGEK